MAYVPAVVLSLYDGYYVYMPTEHKWNASREDWDNIAMTHELKSYVYYSKKYSNDRGDTLVINYSLDNYVVVEYRDNMGNFTSRAGYLEVDPGVGSFVGTDAENYYKAAYDFTNWFNDVVGNFEPNLVIRQDNLALPRVTSDFNDEKYDVIKDSITKYLVPAMHIYNFEMPELTGTDWDLLLNNVCVLAFMQNIPVGTSVYNDYTIAVSTGNAEMVTESDIFFTSSNDSCYHRIWCDQLDTSGGITGYNKKEFKEGGQQSAKLACYYCTVRASNPSLAYAEEYDSENNHPVGYNLNSRKFAYYVALAKEKLNLVKSSEFVNGSAPLS